VGAAVCPKCGTSDQVHTARELLLAMGGGARDQVFQRLNQLRQPGQAQGQSRNSNDDDDYDHYNVEGSDPALGRNTSRRRDNDFASGGDNIVDDIGGAVFGAALGFAGRAIGRRMKRAFEEKVVPAMEAKAAQAQQQWEQSKAEQDAIVARYPELRGCLKDQVIFLDGGYKTVPVSELKMPVTLAQADDVVSRLR
jgi:membrane protease subunit (stomatin/prohibitin family)